MFTKIGLKLAMEQLFGHIPYYTLFEISKNLLVQEYLLFKNATYLAKVRIH